ncbi:MAG TPA: branched-chain amino acid ABC transporter permease [Clostridiales bacterium]|nr:branched-chain amino acid ABC transporter permease [Clostridiales bacterium]
MNGFKTYFTNFKKTFKVKNFIMYFIVAGAMILFGGLGAAGALKRSFLVLLEQMGYGIIVALALSLVVGFLGELSLGHAAFMSIGAFLGCYFQNSVFPALSSSSPFVALLLAMLIGGAAAGAFGFIIGLPALRLKGDYLAIVTLAFGEIVKVLFQNIPVFGGALGIQNKYRYNVNSLYIIIFAVLLLTLIIVQNLIRSKHGRAVTAIRDNEIAAKSTGVNVSYYKIAVFVISAVIAGVGGVLFAGTQNTFKPAKFDYNYSINILVMVVLGGMGNINGTIISAAIITFINVRLGTVLTGNLAVLKDIFYALILIALVIYNNAPALKKFRNRYNLKNGAAAVWNFLVRTFTKKKAEPDPAREVEFGADWSRIPTKVEMDELLSTDFIPETDRPDRGEGGEGK